MGDRFRDFGLLLFHHKFVYNIVFCTTACAQSIESYKNICHLKSVTVISDLNKTPKIVTQNKSTFEAVLSKRKCSFLYSVFLVST